MAFSLQGRKMSAQKRQEVTNMPAGVIERYKEEWMHVTNLLRSWERHYGQENLVHRQISRILVLKSMIISVSQLPKTDEGQAELLQLTNQLMEAELTSLDSFELATSNLSRDNRQ